VNAFFFLRSFFSLLPSLFQDFHRKPPWHLSHNPNMKIVGRAADFCGAKEKREENETMISMGEKGERLFLP